MSSTLFHHAGNGGMERQQSSNLSPPPPSSSSSEALNPNPNPNATSPPPPSSSASSSTTPDGVVVVGFISSRPGADLCHLANRILDANVFGRGNVDKEFSLVSGDRKHAEEWFRGRRISYHYAEETGIVYMQFSSSAPPWSGSADGDVGGYAVALEEMEADDLRGFLFMYLVCNVIIFLHEGSRFDTNLLKKFRLLQEAKNTLHPFIRSQISPQVKSKASKCVSRSDSVPEVSSRSSARSDSFYGSDVFTPPTSFSNPFIFPGMYTPVSLFVFNDVFSDGSSSFSSNADDIPVMKNSNSVVMMPRPTNKTVGSFRKKLQSSLDTQIRFLLKKSRTLVSSESGTRVSSNLTVSLPLFSLDTSRCVSLLDRSTNRRGESLDFVTTLLEDALNNLKSTTSDIFMLENLNTNSNTGGIHAIKEFIYRQFVSLRGKGTSPTNASVGSTSGAGVVAAAAAAAVSTASGKKVSAPKLPSFDVWTFTSSLILDTLLSVRNQLMDEIFQASTRGSHANAKGNDVRHVEASISWLQCSRGLNLKFSKSWCERNLPSAHDVYLKDLPDRYSTAVHESQLEKALQAFQKMVKGPAVPLFAKRLEDECKTIWESGRQLCDVVSLTGRPCIHQRHNVDGLNFPSADTMQHSSGYVFFHACVCGRSRRLRDDPFDFKVANVDFNCFPNCEDFLPSLVPPKESHAGHLSSAWRLVRLGGSRYYDTSKGMLQSGFGHFDKYLSKISIKLEQVKERHPNVVATDSVGCLKTGPMFSYTAIKDTRKDATTPSLDPQKKVLDNISLDENISLEMSNINFGGSLPHPVKMKAFSEVVAGTGSVDSSFPPLQKKTHTKVVTEKGTDQLPVNSTEIDNQVKNVDSIKENHKVSVEVMNTSIGRNCEIGSDCFLQIGSYVVPKDTCDAGKVKQIHSGKHFSVCFGFEYECPHGHRYLMSMEHLKDLGLPKLGKKQNQSKSLGAVQEDLLIAGLSLNDNEDASSLLNSNLPVYMNCHYCKRSTKKQTDIKFPSTISQLQRIFLVTPPFPIVLASSPIIQFEKSCLPPSVLDDECHSQFSIGCRVTLPPESFLAFRLPFVYGVQMDNKKIQPLNHMAEHPELTAWLVQGTTLQIVSQEF